MWIRNSDTGKWSLQTDKLPKDYYDGLKQDIQSVKLYSKCLSGSVFITIDNFDNIYNTLDINKVGYYIRSLPYGALNVPVRGPQLQIDSSNYEEFYQKYLRENAFTIKNLFTSKRLIDSEVKNSVVVDLASTEMLKTLKSVNPFLTIDGVRLIDGHRILLKDQITEVVLSVMTNEELYFENIGVSNYYLKETVGTQKTYYYYNEDNGIYKYTNSFLVRESDLSTYDKSYKLNVNVKYGDINREKQFHLLRLSDDYFPIDGENMEFQEKHNWVLRHRLDYNNVLEINYYDILKSQPTEVYSLVDNFTYSIPERLLAVGEFGVILNNQDKLNPIHNYNSSNIINSKYKVNLRSVAETNDYYWVCGDEGTLLKIYKPNLKIESIDLGIYSQFTCVRFYDNLNGFVIGKFNIIYFTIDGGNKWTKLNYPEYESFSYNKIEFYDVNHVFIVGNNGCYLELTRDGNSWISYKRQIYKTYNEDDYILVDDIFDLTLTNWVTIKEDYFTTDSESLDFAKSSKFTYKSSKLQYNVLQLEFVSSYLDRLSYLGAEFYLGLSVSNTTGLLFSDINYDSNTYPYVTSEFSIYQTPTNRLLSKQISLPITNDGNLSDDVINVEFNIFYNYDGDLDDISQNFFTDKISFQILPTNADITLASTFDKVLVHDIDNKLYDYDNDFIFIEFDKQIGDVRTITKPKFTTDDKIYLGADKLYFFNLKNIIDYPIVGSNYVDAKLKNGPDIYVNKISAIDQIYYVGNDSLLKFMSYSNFGVSNVSYDWDPEFNSRYKSKFLFLDYDIASKLNFFTDLGQYRLPQSVSVGNTSLLSSSSYLEFKSYENQKSWIDYYKDSEKTFEYYTYIGEDNKVEFSTKFTYVPNGVDFEITSSQISTKLDDIVGLAPSLIDSKMSEFFEGNLSIVTQSTATTLSNYDVLIYKNIIIFKREYDDVLEVGDFIRLESSVIDANLLVNKISHYYKVSGGKFELQTTRPQSLPLGAEYEKYVYCFHSFNQNIVNNLINYSGNIAFKVLNNYDTIENLLDKLESHPVSIGYKSTQSNNQVTLSARFNNKTAYYNLSTQVVVSGTTYSMDYSQAFLQFGYSPTYNIVDYLSMIDSNVFQSTKKFTILPEYYGIPGTTFSGILNTIQIKAKTNKITFSSDLKFHWESFLRWTFVDVVCYNVDGISAITERCLILEKYYDESTDGYVIEFHKALNLPDISNGLQTVDVISRNSLQQISDDLQLLNNIQRSSSSKSINSTYSFTNLENETKNKFPTDSYLKVFVSDFDIQQQLTGIVYTDDNYQISFNVINVEKEMKFDFGSINYNLGGSFSNKVSYILNIPPNNEIKVGDLIYVELTGGVGSSKYINPQYQSYQTVIDVSGQTITTSMEFGITSSVQDGGIITFIKKDAFLNYLPIDLYDIGSDRKSKQSIEITPDMIKIEGGVHSLINVNTNKLKLKFIDGLFLEEIEEKYSWFLQADTSAAIIGKNDNGLIWYEGVWKCGRWFGGTWISGEWLSGDWYDGFWYSNMIKRNSLNYEINTKNTDNTLSKWQGGRWFGGIWYGGTWYDGRRYAGDWNDGIWFNGIWNDGNWYGGEFQGGIWVYGDWYGGKFNCDSKLAYWLDGKFQSGDFENGTWYNGQFGNESQKLARFGTRSINTRISTWHAGKWISGEFHSSLNLDENTNSPIVSDVHSLSVWRTGIWFGGDFYGGISYHIDFKGGIWHGGILEEIQVIGIDQIWPALTSSNAITVNGIFKFNPGDEIYVIDNDINNDFSPLGSNEQPRQYRINKIDEDSDNSVTKLYLNYNLSTLIPQTIGQQSWSNIETGLRVVSHFEESTWKSGLWTNGYFESGVFESGIWYNGVMEGNMGL